MTTIHGFELLREQDIPEINAHVRIFRHQRTGAELISLENDDSNKVFGITFATPPEDSTGVAHILEHTVLCGSRKYPVKDPFVQLLKGSLASFVNAMTGSDRTMYPVASQNLQDFYNLIDVYLDAVFYPRITPEFLQQEGWHYELESPDDTLKYQGIVFNEMKGAFSSPDGVLGRYTQQSLFPDTTYGVESGGDPKHIPDLTYDYFKNFHQTHYHPSNSRIWFSGDDDPDERLRLIDDFIRDFDRLDARPEIALQPRFKAPQHLRESYAAEENGDGNKGYISVNWLLSENADPEETLGLNILEYILLDSPASPLRKALIDSGLGEDTSGGLANHIREMYFTTILKGIDTADADKVESLIRETLYRLADEGIEPEMVEAALNSIEFSLREYNTGGFPRGLAMMFSALSTWLYDRDPLAPLAFDAPLQAIKQRVAKGERYFEGLIEKYLLDNPHSTTVLLEPDPTLAERDAEDERARLDAARARMSQAEIEAIVENTHKLREMQSAPDSPEELATLPMLKLEDLDKKNQEIPTEFGALHGSELLYHDLFTNGIVYLDLGLNLHALPQRYLPYMGLFGQALLEMGTVTEDFVRLAQRIGRKTGGIHASALVSTTADHETGTAWMFLRGKCIPDQAQDMLDILRDVLLTVKFDDPERFMQIALEEKAGEEASLVPRGHGVVISRLQAQYNEADWASEQMGGISYLFFLRELIHRIETDWPSVLSDLEEIRQILVNRRTMIANVTLDAANWEVFRPQLDHFIGSIPAPAVEMEIWTPDYGPADEGLTIPAQVNYVGKGTNLYTYGYQKHGSTQVIQRFLNTDYLWENIRVKGGAYGGGGRLSSLSGVYTYYSYRDPNLLQSLATYDAMGAYLRTLDIARDEVVKSIIGAIGSIDSYRLPDAKGYTAMNRHLLGITPEERQQTRDEVLGTTAADFRRFADYLDAVRDHGHIVVLGSASSINAANADLGNRLTITKVL